MFTEKNWENSAVALHAQNCQGSIEFEKTKTVKVEYNRFNRKVCKALEIQLNQCGPSEGGMNLDNGQIRRHEVDYVRKNTILNDDDRKKTVLTSVRNMQCFLFFTSKKHN